MKKIAVVMLNLLVLAACSTSKNKMQEIFGGSVTWIQDTSDIQAPPVFALEGSWSLAANDCLKIILVNGTERDILNVKISIEGDGVLEGKKTIRGADTTEWIIPLPAVQPDSAVLAMMTGMRATPFDIGGIVSTLRPGKIKRIQISFDKTVQGARLGIQSIVSGQADAVKIPDWFSLNEKEFFPFIDKYGQFIHKNWPGKTISDSDLLAEKQHELEEMENNPGPVNRSRYGGWLTGEKQPATGQFYVRKLNGKWWMVDPDGYLFWSNGVVRVTPSSAVTIIDNRENYFSDLPEEKAAFGEFYHTRDEFLYQYYKHRGIKRTYDFSAANLKRKYGANWREAYTTMVHKRMQNWGMNTISAGSDPEIYEKLPVPYCDRIELQSEKISGAPPHLNVIRDPFHPDFETGLTDQLLQRKSELRSVLCYGYFIDNKLVWGAEEDPGRWVLQSKPSQPARKVFIMDLQKQYGDIDSLNKIWKSNFTSWKHLQEFESEPPAGSADDCKIFSRKLIDTYFKKVQQVLHKTAPGKLYLGCRYVSVNESVLKIASKYCDVLTFDLFVDSLDDFRLPPGIDKPVLIGEFHFGAVDRGLFHPGLNPKASQEQRALAYEKYMRSALRNPFIVGTAWHQFSDQATTGRFDGENFQDGLTDVCDRVYPETVQKVRETGVLLYDIRSKD